MKILEPKAFKGRIHYHKEDILCTSCGKEYSITIKNDEWAEDSYCMTCYGTMFGIDEAMRIFKKMDKIDRYFWETPTANASEEMKSKVIWVKKK